MRATIDVTDDDILYGTPRDCERCAVAMAACRALGAGCVVEDADIYGEPMALVLPDGRVCRLPEVASLFVRRFDRREVVGPISFDIDIPDETPEE